MEERRGTLRFLLYCKKWTAPAEPGGGREKGRTAFLLLGETPPAKPGVEERRGTLRFLLLGETPPAELGRKREEAHRAFYFAVIGKTGAPCCLK